MSLGLGMVVTPCADATAAEMLRIRPAITNFPRMIFAPCRILGSVVLALAYEPTVTEGFGARQDNGPLRFTHCATRDRSRNCPLVRWFRTGLISPGRG